MNHRIRNNTQLKEFLGVKSPPGLCDADWLFCAHLAKYADPLHSTVLTAMVLHALMEAAGEGIGPEDFAFPLEQHLDLITDKAVHDFAVDALKPHLRVEIAITEKVAADYVVPFVLWAEKDCDEQWEGGHFFRLHSLLEERQQKLQALVLGSGAKKQVRKEYKDILTYATQPGHGMSATATVDKIQIFLKTFMDHESKHTIVFFEHLSFSFAKLGCTDPAYQRPGMKSDTGT